MTFVRFSEQMTADLIINHLRQQNCKSELVDEFRGICLYRSEDRACAAGCLIPDCFYSKDFEGTKIYFKGNTLNPVGVLIQNLGHNPILVQDFQTIHDSFKPEEWEYKFEEIMNKWKLDYNPQRR